MSINAIHLSNLPHNIHSEELKKQLVENCPEVFSKASLCGTLDSRVFSDGKVTTAVVKGFSFNYERLTLLFRDVRIRKGNIIRDINIKPDTGEARNCNGTFKVKRSAVFRRNLSMLAGETHRKFINLIPSAILDDMNRHIFSGLSDSLYLNTNVFDVKVLMKPGGIKHFKSPQGKSSTIVEFHSTLEQLQGLVYLNRNPSLTSSLRSIPTFTTRDGREQCKIELSSGLGKDGQLIPIHELSRSKGYVPIELFDSQFINEDILRKLTSVCWRCKRSYRIVGVNLNLNSLAGICCCFYPPNIDRDPVAYHWNGDSFTRLILGYIPRMSQNQPNSLLIGHHPIKQRYDDKEDFGNIVIPLLEEEWYFTSSSFKQMNENVGIVVLSQAVETIDEDVSYGLDIVMPRTKVWMSGNPKAIKKLTLIFGYREKKDTATIAKIFFPRVDMSFPYERKAKLFRLLNEESSLVRAYIQVKVGKFLQQPTKGVVVKIVPKPDKSEYKGLRRAVNKWTKEKTDDRMKNLLLNPFSIEKNGWKMHVQTISTNPKIGSSHLHVRKIKLKLNQKQRMALTRAKSHVVSIISGPPGTGKSRTLAAIVTVLSLEEQGAILVCAPSNFAADAIASSIKVLNARGDEYDVKVLRIYSKSRETDFLSCSTVDSGRGTLFDTLHDEVRKSQDWITNAEIIRICNKTKDGKEYLLTEAEKSFLDEETLKIENQVLGKYNVFVSTVGALGDERVNSWSQNGDLISTVVIDEAGQLSQPSTINLFNTKPKRVIFAGDQLQLPPTVISFAASTAGLSKSFMEICSWDAPSLDMEGEPEFTKLPSWTTLNVQYRMHPDIRKVVSKLTYNDNLQDSDSVKHRILPERLLYLSNRFKGKRVALFDHSYLDTMEELSYKNEGESKVICDLVGDMLSNGMKAADITILTFYDAQKQLIRKALGNEELEVQNVDAFQGREKPIIIISFVRSNNCKDIGFLSNQNRINVAISRAQDFLINVFNKNFYKPVGLQHWKNFLDLLDENACVISA